MKTTLIVLIALTLSACDVVADWVVFLEERLDEHQISE